MGNRLSCNGFNPLSRENSVLRSACNSRMQDGGHVKTKAVCSKGTLAFQRVNEANNP
jgi:hypothetical protein